MAKVVVLDPGHDHRSNISPTTPSYIEGVQMWLLAKKLVVELGYYGIDAYTTRPEVTDTLTLAQRGIFAGKKKADIVLSLHSNAASSTAVQGTECFYSVTSPKTKVLCDALGKEIIALMDHNYRGSKTRSYTNNSGIDYYGVIRSSVAAGCPETIIIEHGFHTSAIDANWLLEEDNLDRLAKAEAAAVGEYLGCPYSPPKINPLTGGRA